MKQQMYKIAGMSAMMMAFALKGISQSDVAPVPPPPPPMVAAPSDSGDHPSEIIIRPKGDKDSKVTIEIRDGNFFVNGKPLEKFEDDNIEIEKRREPEAMTIMGFNSPFRENYWDQQEFNQDMMNKSRDIQRKLRELQFNSNTAFLGVSSRKSETGGATVLEVTKSSPAEKAGLKKGDIIIKVKDEKIESPEDLSETIHGFKPGDKVKVTFKREGKEQTVTAVLDKSKNMPFVYKYEYRTPDVPGLTGPGSLWGAPPPRIGIKAQDSEEGKGVNVLDVTDGSAAEKAGLQKGDVITSFDGNEVNNTGDLIQQIRDARDKATVKVKVLRNGKSQEMVVKIPRKLRTAEL
ncbi:MAG TPA: PDZ domain-containing protein [Puia sp.]|nr:PDZ domain-containing protein [Puia sp.]